MSIRSFPAILRLHLGGIGAMSTLDVGGLLRLGLHLGALIVIVIGRFTENLPMFYDVFYVHNKKNMSG